MLQLFLSLILILLAAQTLPAQPPTLPALRAAWDSLPEDTARVRMLSDYLMTHYEVEADTMYVWAKKGYALAMALKDAKGQGDMLQLQGFGRVDASRFEEALPYFVEARKRYLAIPDSSRGAKMLINLGLVQYFLGNIDQALVHYEEAARELDHLGQPEARLFNNMAIIYRKQEKYDKAIALYERSLAMKEASGDSVGIAATCMNLGLLYSYHEDSSRAVVLAHRAAELYRILGREDDLASSYVALGNIYRNFDRPEKAIPVLEQALSYYEQHQEAEYYLNTLSSLGELALQGKEYRRAEQFLSRALALAREAGRLEDLQHLLKELAAVLHEQGKSIQAYGLLSESLALKDSLSDEKRLALTEEMQARFEVREKENELRIQALELERQAQQQRITWGFLGFSGLTIAGILFFLFQKNRSNRLLQEKNQVIEAALREKDLLMREIHHRVKNNLQFISSLLRLQTRHVGDAQAKEALLASRSRVLSMSLIHQHLYQDQQLAGIHLDTYLDRLVSEIVSSSPHEHVALHLELEPLVVDVDTAIPLGLILNELVVNALKYAFEPDLPGILQVRLKEGPDSLSLEVRDNGKGLPDGKLPEDSDSFGYRLIHLLMEKLNGKLEIENVTEGGTQVCLKLPWPKVNDA